MCEEHERLRHRALQDQQMKIEQTDAAADRRMKDEDWKQEIVINEDVNIPYLSAMHGFSLHEAYFGKTLDQEMMPSLLLT